MIHRHAKHLAVLQRRERVGRAYVQGRREWEIAAEESVSVATISRDLAWCRQAWTARAVASVEQQLAEELAKIDQLERFYWEAWERSKAPAEETTAELVQALEARSKAAIRRRQRDGDAAWLAGVQWCIDRRCKLFGLDAPHKIDIEQDIRLWARAEGLDEDAAVAEAERQIRMLRGPRRTEPPRRPDAPEGPAGA